MKPTKHMSHAFPNQTAGHKDIQAGTSYDAMTWQVA